MKKGVVKLKVCGMRDGNNIMEIASLQPDFIGFIFYQKSPRFVGENFKVPHALPSDVKRVGVFVNEEIEVVLDKVTEHSLDYVQLHGNETVNDCQWLAEKSVKVIKAFSVDETINFDMTRKYVDYVTYFLFDTKGQFYGGNASVFNWKLLEKYNQSIPFFLSGGLNPLNVKEALKINHQCLYALDVNSGVELAPALKDTQKVKTIKNILNEEIN